MNELPLKIVLVDQKDEQPLVRLEARTTLVLDSLIAIAYNHAAVTKEDVKVVLTHGPTKHHLILMAKGDATACIHKLTHSLERDMNTVARWLKGCHA